MSAGLRMRDIVDRTGVGEATLRAWESRYGFPAPHRLASGHRRYEERDVEVIRQAVRLRDGGVPVKDAIERARREADAAPGSIYAELRRQRPELQVSVLPKRSLIAISRAIEDESAYGARDLLLFGAFQRERHYRASERRWRELARACELACAFADFAALRRRPGMPIEIPIAARDPLAREWAVVCDSDDRAACMVGWEPPGQERAADRDRRFEVIWTADRETARAAARICCDLAGPEAGAIVTPLAERLAEPVAHSGDELRRAEALTARMIAYLAAA
ncbi:MAG TPA: DICT sensory domain-containing protein [Solirubrobacteraceae bacterium]|nr:DICT sensory domain-containing protein [Solirubrobacteraceae bacterium]